jgi:hypothetical protein
MTKIEFTMRLVILLLLFIAADALDYVFVLHDAGETNFVLPVVTDLLNMQIDLKVFALGEPAISLFADSIFKDVLVTPESMGLETTVIDGNDGRNQTLSERDVNTVLNLLPSSSVIVGMVYAMEAQLAGAYREANSATTITTETIGIFDSFALWSDTSICSTDFVLTPSTPPINQIWLCADEQNVEEFKQQGIRATVTGSPSLSQWRKDASKDAEVAETRAMLLKKASRSDSQSAAETVLAVYAGGYGDQSYNDSVSTFCEAAKALRGATSPPFLFMFSPHPGYSTDYEQSIFDALGCSDDVLVLDSDSSDSVSISTPQVVAASNASLSQCSTVGGQSLSISIPHIYIDLNRTCNDVFTAAALIDNVASTDSLLKKLTVDLKKENYYMAPSKVEGAGVPLNGEERVLKVIAGGR